MNNIIKNFAAVRRSVLCAALFLIIAGCSPGPFSPPDQSAAHEDGTRFELMLTDPLDGSAVIMNVLQMVDAGGIPLGYRIQLVTGVCPEQICQLVDVTLHWNLAGRFDRIEVRSSRPLTKHDHEPFTAMDYARLTEILRDRGSPLREYSISWFAAEQATHEKADALTGATSPGIGRSVVEGAAYTSWVLWHWANGTVVEHLQKLTQQSMTPELLQRLLESGDPDQVLYATDLLQPSGGPPSGTVKAAFFKALRTADHRAAQHMLRYLEAAGFDRDEFHLHLAETAGKSSDVAQRLMLNVLLSEPGLHPAVLETLAEHLPQMSYMGVNLTLTIFERQPVVSERAETPIHDLARSDHAFIARRAREYLNRSER